MIPNQEDLDDLERDKSRLDKLEHYWKQEYCAPVVYYSSDDTFVSKPLLRNKPHKSLREAIDDLE